MNDTLKAWLTGLGTILALVGVAWSKIEPMATWLFANAGIVLLRPMVQAVLTSMAVGILIAGTVPHLPLRRVRAWPPDFTKTMTRLACIVITFSCALVLMNPQNDVEWRTSFVYAMLASGSASATWTFLAGLLYKAESLRPESLK